jgi:hypothetical protein
MKRIIRKRTNRLIRRKKIAIYILLLGFFLSFLSLFLALFYNVLFKVSPQTPVSKSNNSVMLNLETSLKNKSIQYQKIEQGSDLSFYVYLNDGGLIIFSAKKDLFNQISSLQLILPRLTIEGKRLKKLDFRFDKPIIEVI